MPTLTITKSYSNGTVFTESQLDDIKNSVENFTNITKLGQDNLQNDSIGTAQLQNTAVSTVKIANNAVTDAKLSSSSTIDSDRAVSTDHIKNGAVTNAKVGTDAVDTTNIKANAVTQAKLALKPLVTAAPIPAGSAGVTASSGSFTTAANSFVNITNLSATITTTGRPVRVTMLGGSVSVQADTGTTGGLTVANGQIRLLRAAAVVDSYIIALTGADAVIGIALTIPSSSFQYIDFPAAGTYTYTAQALGALGGSIQTTTSVTNVRMLVEEI